MIDDVNKQLDTFNKNIWPENREQAEKMAFDMGYDTLVCLIEEGNFMGRGPSGIWSVGLKEDINRVKILLRYEISNNRKVILWSKNRKQIYDLQNIIRDKNINNSGQGSYSDCKYLCHSTTINSFKEIIKDKALLSYNELIRLGKVVNTIRGSLREPEDFFDYIDLAKINSLAPEKVVASREYKELNFDLNKSYTPGVRIYFDKKKLESLPGACSDGLHILKVFKRLELKHALNIVFPSKLQMENFIKNNKREISNEIQSKFGFVERREAWSPTQYTEEANRMFLKINR